MPEGLEAELYRRLADAVIGRVVHSVGVDRLQPQAAEIRSELPGRRVEGTGRLGKQVWLAFGPPDDEPHGSGGRADRPSASHTIDGPVRLGLHFGMAGRLTVDGAAAIESLAYSSDRWNPDWDRLQIDFTAESGGGRLVVNDPRRWSRFVLDPDLSSLGPDLFDVDSELLWQRLQRRRIAIKAALLDQSVVAGLGNMLVDELLAWSGIAPDRAANEVDRSEVDRLVLTMRDRLGGMLVAGGSHSGVLDPDRRRDLGPCPWPECGAEFDDAQLRRDQVGGRTTVWCPAHQR